MRKAWSLAMTVLITACAAPTQQVTVAPEPVFDPVGVYDFSTHADGQPINGTITVGRAEDGTLSAVLSTTATGNLSMHAITLEGRRMNMRSSIEGETLLVRVDFFDDRITGNWEIGSGMTGTLSGQKRAG